MTILDLGQIEGPILLFGGPYSNLQATQAIKAVAKQKAIPPQNIICNGDVVAYCGDPEETVQTIRDWGIHNVMGNCEESVGEQQDDCGCGFEENTVCSLLSVEWYDYVSDSVSEESRAWMRQLPRKIRFQSQDVRFTVIHGGVENMSEFVFKSSDPTKKYQDVLGIDTDCVIGGHCGIPFGQQISDRYWVNTGVIGMPANDGSQNGWYILLKPEVNTGEVTISWHRLEFDYTAAAKAMKNGGLGSAYHDALLSGLWPSMDILPEVEKHLQGERLQPQNLTLVAPRKQISSSENRKKFNQIQSQEALA